MQNPLSRFIPHLVGEYPKQFLELYEQINIAADDEKEKIVKTINKIFRDKDFKKHAKRKPKSIKDIQITDNWARLKTLAMCVR